MNEINQINISGVDYDIISNSAENKIKELESKINNIPEGDEVVWKNELDRICTDADLNIDIGTNTYLGTNVWIGNDVSIGKNVVIPDDWSPGNESSEESITWSEGDQGYVVCGNIKIGSRVAIGTRLAVYIAGPATISELDGIQIGNSISIGSSIKISEYDGIRIGSADGIYIGSGVFIDGGFDSRNITGGSGGTLGTSPLWTHELECLLSSEANVTIEHNVRIERDVRIGSNSYIDDCCLGALYGIQIQMSKLGQIWISEGRGIILGSEASPSLLIGTDTQIGNEVYIPDCLQFESNDQGLLITDTSKQKSIQLNWNE